VRSRKKIQSSNEPFERVKEFFVETLTSVVLGVLGSLGVSHYLYLSCYHSKRS
jgi:hypothetical protein